MGFANQAFGVWWLDQKGFAELADLCHPHFQAGWSQSRPFRHPWKDNLAYLHVGLDWNTPSHGPILFGEISLYVKILLLSMIWWTFSYICCADPMEESPEIQESSIAVFHLMWRNGRQILGLSKLVKSLGGRHSRLSGAQAVWSTGWWLDSVLALGIGIVC